MHHLRLFVLVALFLAGRCAALAFNGHVATEGPLTRHEHPLRPARRTLRPLHPFPPPHRRGRFRCRANHRRLPRRTRPRSRDRHAPPRRRRLHRNTPLGTNARSPRHGGVTHRPRFRRPRARPRLHLDQRHAHLLDHHKRLRPSSEFPPTILPARPTFRPVAERVSVSPSPRSERRRLGEARTRSTALTPPKISED